MEKPSEHNFIFLRNDGQFKLFNLASLILCNVYYFITRLSTIKSFKILGCINYLVTTYIYKNLL